VLIVNYNNSKYIKNCINSVLNQNYSNVEIVFLDDGSNDNSLDEIKKFKNKILIAKKKRKKKNLVLLIKFKVLKNVLKNQMGTSSFFSIVMIIFIKARSLIL
jgi:glycosyltransferase involved in cell wall biosynthesis